MPSAIDILCLLFCGPIAVNGDIILADVLLSNGYEHEASSYSDDGIRGKLRGAMPELIADAPVFNAFVEAHKPKPLFVDPLTGVINRIKGQFDSSDFQEKKNQFTDVVKSHMAQSVIGNGVADAIMEHLNSDSAGGDAPYFHAVADSHSAQSALSEAMALAESLMVPFSSKTIDDAPIFHAVADSHSAQSIFSDAKDYVHSLMNSSSIHDQIADAPVFNAFVEAHKPKPLFVDPLNINKIESHIDSTDFQEKKNQFTDVVKSHMAQSVIGNGAGVGDAMKGPSM